MVAASATHATETTMPGGSTIYASLWSSNESTPAYGIYRLAAEGPQLMLADPKGSQVGYPMRSGWIADGKLCGYYVKESYSVVDEHYYIEVNADGETTRFDPLPDDCGYMFAATYNPDDRCIYGYGLTGGYSYALLKAPADNPGAPVPWLQLLTILGFITLISFGSDTFFERMCGVFALPMAVGVTWPLMRGGERHMLKVYLIFFMVAFGSIWTTRQYNQYRLYRVPMDEFPHHRGLLAHPVQYGGYKVNRAAIESCRRNGKSYMVFGARLNLLYHIRPG